MERDSRSSNLIIGNIYLALAILFSSACTLLTKSFTSHIISYIDWEKKAKDYFNHPIFMNGIMFFGEYLCLLVFLIVRYAFRVAIPNKKKIPIPPYYYSLPAFCDFISSGISYLAFAFAAGSVTMMMQYSTLIWTAILSIIFLSQRYHTHQIFGLSGCIIGIVLIGLSTMDAGTTTSLFGFVLLLVSNLVFSIQIVIENKLFANYEINVLESVGFEGLFGLLYCLITFPLFQFWKMPQLNLTCINGNQGPYIYNFPCSGVFVY